MVLALYRYCLISLTNPLNMSSTGRSKPFVALLEVSKQSSHLQRQGTCQQKTQLRSAPCLNSRAKKNAMKQRPATFTARLLRGKHTRKKSSGSENSAKRRVGLALAVRRKRINCCAEAPSPFFYLLFIPPHDIIYVYRQALSVLYNLVLISSIISFEAS